jgi:dCTP deaminase
MSIKSDKWIRRMAQQHGLIEPFEPGQVRMRDSGRLISYGTSSYGYDVRCAREFKIFTNINSSIVDPKQFDEKSFVDVNADVCIIPPNSFALARTVEYFRIPRNVLCVTMGKSTYARCFRGDTRVALVNGESPTLEEMARRHDSGEQFWGYSLGPSGRIIVTLLDMPRFIGRDSLFEITLDNDERVRATPDHVFVRRDGRFAQAGELRPGDSVMPLYRNLQRGYEHVYQPINGHLLPTHRLADEWNLRHDIYKDQPGSHRHHIDFDRRNNNPVNLERMGAADHIRLHNDESYGEEFDPEEHGASIRAAFVRLGTDPLWRERFAQAQAQRARQFWNDQRFAEIRQRVLEARRNPSDATREAHRIATLRCFPEVVAQFAGRRDRNHKVTAVRELPGDHDVYCLTVPEAGNFALEAGVFVENCGIIVNVTPLEPEWEGHVTLEFSNTTPLPAKIYANEGVAQMLFFESDEVCETSYADRGGKYQKQRGVTLPKA